MGTPHTDTRVKCPLLLHDFKQNWNWFCQMSDFIHVIAVLKLLHAGRNGEANNRPIWGRAYKNISDCLTKATNVEFNVNTVNSGTNRTEDLDETVND